MQRARSPLGICSVIYANSFEHIQLMNTAFIFLVFFQAVLDGTYLGM